MTNLQASGDNNFGWRKFLPVVAGVLLIYLLYPTKNFYWDGIYFSSIIEDAPALDVSLLHPNHLFYNVVGYLAYQAAHLFGWQIRAVYLLEFVSSLFSAASAIVFFFILKRLLKSNYLSFVLTLLFAFSATWWKFSTDADAYIPCVFFLLIAFYLLLPNQPPRPLLVALAHTAAMFLHELAVLFFFIAVLGIIFQTASLERRRRILLILQYGLTAFLLTFGTFCLSFYISAGTFDLKRFAAWMTSYSPENGFSFDAWRNLTLTLRGNFRLFVDGRFNFFELDLLNAILAIILGAAFVGLIIKIWRSFGDLKMVWRTIIKPEFYRHPATLLCATWILTYTIFLFFFIPANTFYRLLYLPAFIILFGWLLASSGVLQKSIRQWRTALLVAVVALANFLFFIRPYSQVRPETPLSLALELNQQWSGKTVVYYESLNSDNRLIRYFNPATVWKPLKAEMTADDFALELRTASQNGETVWVETSALDRLESRPELARQIAGIFDAAARVELINRAHRLKFARLALPPVGD